MIERQYRKLRVAKHFVDPVTGDTREIPADWEDARIAQLAQAAGVKVIKRPVVSIRWTTTAEDVVLYDDWSAYKHFTVVPFSRSCGTERPSGWSRTCSTRRTC